MTDFISFYKCTTLVVELNNWTYEKNNLSLLFTSQGSVEEPSSMIMIFWTKRYIYKIIRFLKRFGRDLIYVSNKCVDFYNVIGLSIHFWRGGFLKEPGQDPPDRGNVIQCCPLAGKNEHTHTLSTSFIYDRIIAITNLQT